MKYKWGKDTDIKGDNYQCIYFAELENQIQGFTYDE